MSKIKTDIPSVETLQAKLHTIMESGIADFIKTTHARRIAVRASIRFVVVSVLFIVAIAVFLFMAQIDLNTLFGKIVAMIALLWVTVLLVSGRRWFIGSTLLAREINMALVPILANTLNRTLLYTYNENAVETVAELLNESDLLEEEPKNLSVKSVYTVFSDSDMRVHEVEFNQKPLNPGGKEIESHVTFIDVNVAHEHASSTILTHVGNRYGFSQQRYVQHLQNNVSFESAEVTDDNLKAFTTETTEGNNFLTSELLQIVSDWGSDVKVNIRVMRKGTKLYILVPASKESATYTSTSTDQEAVERYAEVIARPIWRALTLVEELRV